MGGGKQSRDIKGGSGQGCFSPQPTPGVWEGRAETLSGKNEGRMEAEKELQFKIEVYGKRTAWLISDTQ